MHLWMHTFIAAEDLTRDQSLEPAPTSIWRTSVQDIGDILVLSDIIDPKAYYSLPLVNQCFYVAGSCYVRGV